MPRTGLFLVTAALHCLIFGCGPKEAPKHLFVDSRCSPTEREAIQKGIQAWNDVGAERLGEPLIVFEGYYRDNDWIDIDTDLSDDRSVMYCVNDRRTYERLTAASDTENVGGISFGSDMAVFPFVLADKRTGWINPKRLARTATHELGHWLGLPHSVKEDSVMQRNIPLKVLDHQPGASDIENICIIYGC